MDIRKTECKTRMCDNCESVDSVKLIDYSSDCMFLCKECRKELYNLLKQDLAPLMEIDLLPKDVNWLGITHLKDRRDKHEYKRNSK